MKQENSEIGKKVLTDGLDLGLDVQAHMKCHLDKYPTLVLVSTQVQCNKI